MVDGCDPALAGAAADRSAPGHVTAVPGINPATGLSTDYLNHFTEVIMVLEMLTSAPDCLPDLEAWRPKSYCQHFSASRLSNRDAALAAYRAADPKVRHELDRVSDVLNAALTEIRDIVLAKPPNAAELASQLTGRLRPLVWRTAALINGTAAPDLKADGQAAIDALFP